MTDRELLELAAKAAGIVGNWERDKAYVQERYYFKVPYDNQNMLTGFQWNPITDDGEALRLAVKVGILVAPPAYTGGWQATASAKADETPWVDETSGSHEEATRRAIVRAAAEIGKAMQ